MRPAGREGSLYFDYPHFPFRRPPELEGEAPEHAVAIVGAGPVGLTAALELARHGIASVVLDEKDSVNDGSRAICIARHSFECLQQLGLHERFLGKALPWTHGTSYYRDRPVFRLEMPHSDDERFHPMYNLQQQYIEQFLVDAAAAEPLIGLRWQSRLAGMTQDADGATLRVATPEGEYSLRSQWLLAADGARSAVRSALGLKLKGDAYEGRYVIADIRMRSDYPTERRAFFDPSSNPGLTILVHKQPEDIWRVDYQIEADEEASAVLEENIRARVGSIVGMIEPGVDWELEWWSIYKAYTLALDDYRCGRTLFIGDAAHLVPIFGVRGLNSGFADAMNAGWKLAAVLHGDAPAALLDSYSPERRGATLEVFRNASKSTRFMTPPSRGYELMREAALSLALDSDFARPLVNPRQAEPWTYADCALTSFPERDAGFGRGPQAGAPLVNHHLGDDSYLLDHLGSGFTLLVFVDQLRLPPGLSQACARFSVAGAATRLLVVAPAGGDCDGATVLVDADGSLRERYGAEAGSAYLVRPDRHVAARWRSLELAEWRVAVDTALARADANGSGSRAASA